MGAYWMVPWMPFWQSNGKARLILIHKGNLVAAGHSK
jgi:hypothetical protein